MHPMLRHGRALLNDHAEVFPHRQSLQHHLCFRESQAVAFDGIGRIGNKGTQSLGQGLAVSLELRDQEPQVVAYGHPECEASLVPPLSQPFFAI